jgi:hypothetical protein
MIETKRRTDFERFVRRTDTCWLWTGGKNPAGYGVFRVGAIRAGAHRWAWQWTNGTIPAGMEVHHTCHIRACVNPTHLTLMTRRQNLQNRRYSSWLDIDGRVPDSAADLVTVTLTPEHSAWVKARAAETGESPDELVARAMYRYMARWLGKWKDSSE